MTTEEEIRFENRFFLTAQFLRPVYWRMNRGLRCIYIGFLVLATAAFFSLQTPDGSTPLAVIVLFAAGIAGLLMPFLHARTAARNYRKLMNSELPETVVHYTDGEISAREARNEYHYQYSQLVRVRSSRRLWLLMLDRRIGLIVNKEGFTQGRAEDFPAFIRSKCPGIKGTFK